MPLSHLPAVAGPPSHSAAYDIVLLAHVLSALVGFGAVVVSGAFAVVLARSGPESEAVHRYYRPGVNWAGRVLFLVPVFGAILVLISKGAWSFSDRWVAIGLVLWVVVAFGAEMALWPAERKLQVAVGARAPIEAVRSLCTVVAAMAAGGFVVLVAASVIMVAKP
jgi:uncharacterized membrane protein